jgi:hypothetical protein
MDTNEPPQAVIELASLALTYGINIEAAADLAAAVATTGPSTTSSPVKQPSRQQQEKSTSTANINNNNNTRLNARQRRTLRRALDRALAALENGKGERTTTDIDSSDAGPQNHNLKNNQQQATYKTPMKTHNYTYNNVGEENEYLQMTPAGANTNNNNNNDDGVLSMAFGSPAFMHPQAHHSRNWVQNGAVPMPMHVQMDFHAVAALAAENAMAQMAQQHHVHAAAAAAAAGYMGPMPMSPPQHHHMMAVAGPAVYHQDRQQMQQYSMGHGAAKERINKSSRFAPKVAAR